MDLGSWLASTHEGTTTTRSEGESVGLAHLCHAASESIRVVVLLELVVLEWIEVSLGLVKELRPIYKLRRLPLDHASISLRCGVRHVLRYVSCLLISLGHTSVGPLIGTIVCAIDRWNLGVLGMAVPFSPVVRCSSLILYFKMQSKYFIIFLIL